MRALIGSPGRPGNVEFRDVEPPAPNPDELVLDVKAFAVNRGELSLLASRPEGWRPGQDIAGVVVQAAADGSGPPAGAKIVALTEFCGWSQRAAAKTSRVAVLPEGVTFAAAASLPVAGLTALRALRAGGSILGRRVLVTGATGGVGTFAVQLARRGGASAVAAVGSDASLLRELGASEIYPAMEEVPGTFDVILESVGGASLAGSLHRVAAGGTVVMFGNSSQSPTTFPGFPDFRGRIGSKLLPFGVYYSGEVPTFGEDLGFLAASIAEKKLDPVIGATASWTKIAEVLGQLKERRIRGKAVFTVE